LPSSTTFAARLRAARLAAELSQEQLAELARISTSAIGAYERGIHVAPHRDTVTLLADALGLTGPVRSEFEAAARRKPPEERARSERDITDDVPLDTTHFVGRSVEVEQIEELLRRQRIVTLIGPGGIGKTRIAIQVARQFAKRRQRVCIVSLASVTDERFVGSQIATALGIPHAADGHSPESLAKALRNSSLLFVLDNCEHVIETASRTVAAIARACPEVRILSTSRERLRIGGEATYSIAPLPMPRAPVANAQEAMRFGAIELFVSRAMTAERSFTFDDDCCKAVLGICGRLDGIPLAIELAAMQVPLFGLNGVLHRLDRQLPALSAGGRDMPTRQQTLRATFEWSYELLTANERILFRRLALLAGSWTLDAAKLFSADESANLATLTGLLEKSLMSIDNSSATTRYRMLEVTKTFALEKAASLGEGEQNARRHAEWVADRASHASSEKDFIARHLWHEAYDADLDNARAALSWCLSAGGDPLLAARIVFGYRVVWNDGGLQTELRTFAQEALARIDRETHPGLAASLLLAITSTLAGAERIATGKLTAQLFEKAGDAVGVGRAWERLAIGYRHIGDLRGWINADEKAIGIFESGPLARSLITVHAREDRAQALFLLGRLDDSELEMTQALRLARAHGDFHAMGNSQLVLAEIHFHKGDPDKAIESVSAGIESLRQARTPDALVWALANRAAYYLAVNDDERSRSDATQALLMVLDLAARNASYVAFSPGVWSVQFIAAIEARSGKPARAARLLGWVEEQLRQNPSFVRSETEQRAADILATSLGQQLTENSQLTFMGEGALLSESDAIALAIGGQADES
jgi:predicted ATPase/DNA-binding XRE family transcriptional regulator